MSTAPLEALLKSQPALWRGRDQHNDYAAVPTGYAQLDNVLPSGGWGIGCLTELLLEQQGIGELSLLLPALQQVTSDNQWAAFVNPPYLPYAPALANSGINLERLLIINTDNDTDTLWASEQLLRAGIFASVVGWVNRTTAQKQRRLQLAAELGKTWATIYRPANAQDQHSPAALRIVIGTTALHTAHHTSHHMKLDIIKSRGGKQHSININPTQFDQSQGAEWPAISLEKKTSQAISSIAPIAPVAPVAPDTPIKPVSNVGPIAPVKPAPVELESAEPTPVELEPAEPTPVELEPAEHTPVEPAVTKQAPSKP